MAWKLAAEILGLNNLQRAPTQQGVELEAEMYLSEVISEQDSIEYWQVLCMTFYTYIILIHF
jgi:hypothetical protein